MSALIVSTFTGIAAFLNLSSFILALIGIFLTQFNAIIVPDRLKFPQYTCEVSYYFFKSRTECPGQRAVVNNDFGGKDILNCGNSYHTIRAAYAFTIISLIVISFSLVAVIVTHFTKVGKSIPTYLTLFALITFTITWPLSWSLTTSKQCGSLFTDYKTETLKVADTTRGEGCTFITTAWALCFPALYVLFLRTKADAVEKLLSKTLVPSE